MVPSPTSNEKYGSPPATIRASLKSKFSRMPGVALPFTSEPAISRNIRKSSPFSSPFTERLTTLYFSDSGIRWGKAPGTNTSKWISDWAAPPAGNKIKAKSRVRHIRHLFTSKFCFISIFFFPLKNERE